jgi:transposase
MGRKRNKYPREFKLEAVRLMQKRECTIAELARRLNVQEHDLRDWEKQYAQKGDDAFPGQGRTNGAAAEIARLKRELDQVKEERDILKKAMAFFARESR